MILKSILERGGDLSYPLILVVVNKLGLEDQGTITLIETNIAFAVALALQLAVGPSAPVTQEIQAMLEASGISPVLVKNQDLRDGLARTTGTVFPEYKSVWHLPIKGYRQAKARVS